MLTSLQIKKQSHFFNILDFDHNGYIEEQDFENIGENLCVIRDFDIGTPNYSTVMDLTREIWKKISKYVKNERGGTKEEWLEYIGKLLDSKNEDSHSKYTSNLVDTLMRLFDINHDGMISRMEYIDLFIGMRIEVRFVPKAFRKLDANNDGYLSRSEMHQSVKEFMNSNDFDTPGNWLFGSWEEDVIV